jgi:endonuclease/exonuclease/phosphatase family metal-dependent hydrolase
MESLMRVKFSAMTFNMQFGQRWDAEAPDRAPVVLEDTIDFLRKNPHDIYLLQEVERALPGGRQIEPPPNFTQLQAALPGYHSVFAYPRINPDELPFGVALAVFSRMPLSNFEPVDLPPADVRFEFEGACKEPSHRQLLRVSTAFGGRDLMLFNTHLQAFFMIGASSNDHREQRDLVEKAIRESGTATLLAGDFNCSPEEDVVAQFARAGFQTAQQDQITWRRRPYVTDHLFYNAHLRMLSVQVLETGCSDHHAVSAEFGWAD